jgi:formate/nitrite transporter FocA (FNT family)
MPDDLQAKADSLEEDTTPETPVIYEAVRRLGEQELARPPMSLVWSGLAAGLSMGFSLLAQGVLHRHLPAGAWRELGTALGYPVGFLMVVLSRQQLFTENTITVVLPLLARPGLAKLAQAARMWGIVLACNLVGTALFAAFIGLTQAVPPELQAAMVEVSRAAVLHAPLELGLGAVVAGYLMAAMVWLITSSGSAQVPIVGVMTWLIGVCGFGHIVAGTAESVMLVVHGQLSWTAMLAGFSLPVLVGNVVGGTLLFALLSHAQVMHETDDAPPPGAERLARRAPGGSVSAAPASSCRPRSPRARASRRVAPSRCGRAP